MRGEPYKGSVRQWKEHHLYSQRDLKFWGKMCYLNFSISSAGIIILHEDLFSAGSSTFCVYFVGKSL